MARKVSDINASSQADIAFLLLIFFLVTTSMSVDQGLTRQLPPPAQDKNEADKVNERNILSVLINKDNMLMINAELADIEDLYDRTRDFILNPRNLETLPEKIKVSSKLEAAQAANKADDISLYSNIVSELGENVEISKGVVSLQNDRGTKYEVYIKVQNELVAAFNSLRDDLSKETWGKLFDELNDEQQKLIKTVYPLSISEAEPRSVK